VNEQVGWPQSSPSDGNTATSKRWHRWVSDHVQYHIKMMAIMAIIER
jgi:hypothetical protein